MYEESIIHTVTETIVCINNIDPEKCVVIEGCIITLSVISQRDV